MLRMLKALEVSAHKLKFVLNSIEFKGFFSLQLQYFNFQGVGIYKQNIQSLRRHLNTSQQMMYVKKLERQKEEHFPKPIFVNNHVHYIGKT